MSLAKQLVSEATQFQCIQSINGSSTDVFLDTAPPTTMSGESGRPPGNFIHTDRSMGRHHASSVEDYSRVMLEYTRRRMAGFADTGGNRAAPSYSSRSSNTSENSTSDVLAGQAASHSPPKSRHGSAGDVHDPAGLRSAI
ncbi:hypothetical protein BJX61DRAFT_545513 [Aspergillus egyptiacus]|nr:hypothetical protein BJX61DRAFT_545513 [Aspergillus egyptiacus]